ncbi:MAG TPA: DUF2019 domain-containing protein [Patescibacteria group bacterium]|nr:DUF2019 domain-containing protein [Patescibacteria group bacterium]
MSDDDDDGFHVRTIEELHQIRDQALIESAKELEKYDLPSMCIDDMMALFEHACMEQYDTYVDDDLKKYNINYNIMIAVNDELKARGVQARLSLLRFFDHPNLQVRVKAATLTYRVAPEAARRCLDDIAKAGFPDQSLAAGMTLRAIDNGTSMLT